MQARVAGEKGHTFRPNVNRRPASAGRARPGSKGAGAGGGSIFERLHETSEMRRKVLNNRETEKEKEDLTECTFQPKLTDSGLKKRQTREEQKAMVEKLSASHASIKTLRDEIKKQKDLAQCTFKPQLNATSITPGVAKRAAGSKTPIWKRLNEETKDTAELETMHAQAELVGCTFKPAVGRQPSPARQRKIQAEGGKTIFDRLYTEVDKRDRVQERERQRAASELAGCTFQPKILADGDPEGHASPGGGGGRRRGGGGVGQECAQ
jgi:hypothetical protein